MCLKSVSRYSCYDPVSGNWATEDPIKDGNAWYAYCNNNPVNFIDPLGLDDRTVLGAYFDWVQEQIDRLEQTARRKGALTSWDKNFMLQMYKTLTTGGYLLGMPEAAQLITRYMAPSMWPQKLNPAGKTKENPFIINSEIYTDSSIVQYAMSKMKNIIRSGVSGNKLIGYTDITSGFLSPTNRDPVTEGNVLADGTGRLKVEQANTRLFYADNRFTLRAKSEVLEDGRIKTTWYVLEQYDFQPYPVENQSRFTILDDINLTIDDGLSEYMAELGLAEEFWYKAEWEEIWDPKCPECGR